MTSKASYILDPKKEKTKEPKENKPQKNILCTWTFKHTLMNHFNLSDEQCVINDAGVILTINVNDINSYWNGLTITVHQLPQSILMDIYVEGCEDHNVEILETFDSVLVEPKIITTYSGQQQCIIQDHDIIKTYDDVSSYYCRLIYPKLDEFDRKMRLLLYNTYYLVYGSDFPYKFKFYCPNDRLSIRGKHTDENAFCSNNFFYAYDYSQLIDILFVHTRQAPDGSEKTDWELYFADKIQFSQSKKDIEDIKGFRNKIAHCKLFSKSDYIQTNLLLNKYCIALDKAIDLTYSKDFFNEFLNSIKSCLEQLKTKLNEIELSMQK